MRASAGSVLADEVAISDVIELLSMVDQADYDAAITASVASGLVAIYPQANRAPYLVHSDRARCVPVTRGARSAKSPLADEPSATAHDKRVRQARQSSQITFDGSHRRFKCGLWARQGRPRSPTA